MAQSSFKDAVKALKDMFSTAEFKTQMAQMPFVYALSGSHRLAAAMHGLAAVKLARARWMNANPLFRKPLAEALLLSADRIPRTTALATSPRELIQLAQRHSFPIDNPEESWMIHRPVEIKLSETMPEFLRKRVEKQLLDHVKTDLVNVPRDAKGTVNMPVLRHELGHVKDFADGKAQQDQTQAPIKHVAELFSGVVNPDDTALGRMEVRAWDNADVPAGHPVREAALDTYRHLHRYKLAQMITQIV